jgi:hypothetical protein
MNGKVLLCILCLFLANVVLREAIPVVNGETRTGALHTGTVYATTAVIDTANGFAYYGNCTGPTISSFGYITKVSLSSFSVAAVLQLNQGQGLQCITASTIDPANGFAYFATKCCTGVFSGSLNAIIKIRLADFTRVAALEWLPHPVYSAVMDTAQGFGYFMDDTGLISKLRVSNFTIAGTLQTPLFFSCSSAPPFDCGGSAVIDSAGGFAYFGDNELRSQIVQLRLSDFSVVKTLTLNTGENSLVSGVIDASKGFAYFGTNTAPAMIVKVLLSNFTRVGAITLNVGENYTGAAVIDSPNGFAYFATASTPGLVVRLRLSNFTRVDSLTLNPGEGSLNTALLDPTTNNAYFGTGGFIENSALPTMGVVVRVSVIPSIAGDFTFSPIQGMAGLPESFTAAVTGGLKPYSISWDLGDGSTSAGSTVTHSYAIRGSYVVTMTATDANGARLIDVHAIFVRLEGDVNNDCTVDVADLSLVGAAFGASPGPPPSVHWNPFADLNNDGSINIVDLVVVASHFGTHC